MPPADDKTRKKVGLALGSGGVRGLAHIGVIRVLERNNIPIDYLAGTSVGAWVASHYGLFRDINRLEKFTVGRKMEKLVSFFEVSLGGGLIRGRKIEQLLDDWLEGSSFENTMIPVRTVATEIISGESSIFSSGRMAPAIMASMAVPTVFRPFRCGDGTYVDGGISDPVPADVVRDMGADIVIAVNLDNFRMEGMFSTEDARSIPRVTGRSVDLLRHYLARRCVDRADVVIEPKNAAEHLSRWRSYFTGKIDRLHMSMGEKAAEAEIPLIKSLIFETGS